MKVSNRRSRWLLGITTVALMALILSACKVNTATPPSTPTPDAVAEAVETAAPALEPFNPAGPAAPAAPTATPVVITLEGAKTTDTGLQYLEQNAGTGTMPKKGEIITMNYIATLPDGTELVNTYTQGTPVTTVFGANRLLPGWEEGLGMMKTGTKAKLVIPPDQAFGAEGSGAVPPNTQLVMEIELLSSEPAPVPTEFTEGDLTSTDSGLKYFDISVGEGEEAVKNSNVSTNFTLWVKTDSGYDYVDSSAFSSAVDFTVGRKDVVFPGWDEGVTNMKVGGKRLLIIPPTLGMGAQEGLIIPPNSTLVMEVELVSATEPRVPAQVDEKDYVTNESGLKYYDLVEGTGATPEAGQTVVVHYTGWLADGTQFDSSVDRGEPFAFPLGQGRVIPGWDEGVSTMKVGSKRQLVIPPDMAYGAEGASGVIPPNATLIFEVELIEIQD